MSDIHLDEGVVLIDACDAIFDGGGARRPANKNDVCLEASPLPFRRRGIS